MVFFCILVKYFKIENFEDDNINKYCSFSRLKYNFDC